MNMTIPKKKETEARTFSADGPESFVVLESQSASISLTIFGISFAEFFLYANQHAQRDELVHMKCPVSQLCFSPICRIDNNIM